MSQQRRIVTVELNRVEGDLEVRIEEQAGRIESAWVVGTMYRGFEQLLLGRAATDGIVITPRICGICGTAHQYAAVTAIESVYGCEVAPHGTRVRNVCLMAEEAQSDPRHTFLMFTIDFCHGRYADHPMAAVVREMFEPFRGSVYREVVQNTKEILKIVALLGGQWPHSSYMVPGGVTAPADTGTLIRAIAIVDAYTRWYERVILGCSIERWLANRSLTDLETWLEESPRHRDSAVGVFLRFGRSIGLSRLGMGNGNLLSFGNYFEPETSTAGAVPQMWRAAGFRDGASGQLGPFQAELVEEHARYSWAADYEGGRHPSQGETLPNYAPQTERYSWAKAPRYNGQVVEVGVLAELVAASDPLMTSLLGELGSNCLVRQFARLHRPTLTLPKLRATLGELVSDRASPYFVPVQPRDGSGGGLLSAARGGLGHWVEIQGGKIAHYQVITPTAWNASPRDSAGNPGHWEQSMIGTELRDPEDPVELGHIVRSHDACLVCTVHMAQTGQRVRFTNV